MTRRTDLGLPARLAAGTLLATSLFAVAGPALAATPLVVPATAGAAVATEVTPQQIAAALLDNASYVEPGYSAVSPAEAESLTRAAVDSNTPIYLALVSDETSQAAGGLDKLLKSVESQTNLPGTYVIADSQGFRATSTMFQVADIAEQAAAGGGGANQVLGKFIDLVSQRAATPANAAGSDSAGSSDGGQPWLAWLLVGGAAVGGGTWFVRSRRRTQASKHAELEAVRATLTEDITVIGEQIAAINASDPALGDAGRDQLAAGIAAYNRARTACDAMTDVTGAQQVTAALDDARYAVSAAAELAAGRPLPARRPPCLFDPRHGTSSRDVMWAPPSVYGQAPAPARPVPACEVCARTVDLGGVPASRMVQGAAGPVPYWAGGPTYAPYASGYYNSYGSANMLGGLLIGTMFASMYAPTFGYGMDPANAGAGDLGAGSFGGDIGGGDFGAGDFGGGDFGGGF